MYLLGYIPSHNRVYLADKDVNVYGYALSLSLVEYQTAILRGDMDAAAEILPSIPKEQRNKIARFLELRGTLSSHFVNDVNSSLKSTVRTQGACSGGYH